MLTNNQMLAGGIAAIAGYFLWRNRQSIPSALGSGASGAYGGITDLVESIAGGVGTLLDGAGTLLARGGTLLDATIAADNDPTTDEDIGVAPQTDIPGVSPSGVQTEGGTRGAGTVEYQIGRDTALLGSGTYNVPPTGYTGRQLESLIMGAASVHPGAVVKPGIVDFSTGKSVGGSLVIPGDKNSDSAKPTQERRVTPGRTSERLREAYANTRANAGSRREREHFDQFGDE